MRNRLQSRLAAIAKDVAEEIEIDTRKKEVADMESRAAADRIQDNTVLLKSLNARLNGHAAPATGAPQVAPQNLLPRRPRSKKAMRKLDYVISTIATLAPLQEFTPGFILAEIQRLYPEAGITRAQLSSLMWKLSTLPEGKTLYKQIKRNGGNVEARYVRLEGPRIFQVRPRPPQPVPQADIFENLAGAKNGQ
jgi:hypothetical protein